MKRYTVTFDENCLLGRFAVTDTKTSQTKYYEARNFVRGQIHYLDHVGKYPNYVHAEIWRLHDQSMLSCAA